VAATDAADRAASEAEAARVVAEQTDNYLTDAADAYAKHVEARRSIDDSLRSLGLTDPGNLDSDRLSALLAERRAALAELSSAHQTLELSGAVERVASLEKEVANLRRSSDVVAAKVADAQRRFELAKQIDSATRAVANEISIEQFETVMPLLKELYRRLRPHNEWTEINSEFGGKVRASLNFTVGNGKNPQFLFSSGQRRAAGLAFLLAVHLSRPWCQWRSILLDDPVQHVDDYRALNLVEVLSAIRRSGRQVVIAVEDPSLADLLCRRLRSSSAEPGVRIDLDAGLELPRIHMISPMPKSILSLRATG